MKALFLALLLFPLVSNAGQCTNDCIDKINESIREAAEQQERDVRKRNEEILKK